MIRAFFSHLLVQSFLFLIRGYQLLVSPLIGPRCRFYPTCSEYSRLCLQNYGFLKGLFLSLKRISRCHPLGTYGYDPIPEEKK